MSNYSRSAYRSSESSKTPPVSNLSLTEFQLGLVVSPNDVRLQADIQDGCEWAVSPEKVHLCVKPLSKLSLGVDMKLCRDIGPSSEAIRLQLADQRTESADVPPRKDHEVQEALPRWQKTAQDELVARQDLEIRNKESQLMLLALQKESTRLEKENSRLCIELWDLNDRMESLRQHTKGGRNFSRTKLGVMYGYVLSLILYNI